LEQFKKLNYLCVSLTPALSRWEREKRSLRFGKTKAEFSLSAYEFYEISQRLFLLPAGEGQDEGGRDAAISDGR
jgi:hypothetical protein